MQTSMYDDEEQSVFIFGKHFRSLFREGRQIGAHVSGGLLAIGWWVFIDAVISSEKYNGESHMGFEDWFSGILTTFGMIFINLIKKNRLQGEEFSFAGTDLIWEARLYLFLGFALIAGGFAGSCCVLVIKYIVHLESARPYLNYGIAGVCQSGLILLSTIVLWVAQSVEDEFGYNVQL